jgi:hypothetical protein
MPAVQHDLKVEQGSYYSKRITVYQASGVPLDLTNYSAVFAAKVRKDDLTTVIESDDNLTITLGGVTGTIDLVMLGADTTDLIFDQAYYNLKITNTITEVPIRLMEGLIVNSKEVTI